MAKLPEGVKICIGGKTYRGEIPDALLPENFREKHKMVADGSKHKTVKDGDKPKGTGGE